MSGKTPGPQKPLKLGKVKVKVSLVREEPSNAAEVTVLPSNVEVRPEDASAAPRYEGVAPVRGMFRRGAVTAAPSGTRVGVVAPPPKRKLTREERLALPLGEEVESESEDEEALRSAEEEEAPKPPPAVSRLVVPPPKPLAAPPPPKTTLPPVARALLGERVAEEKPREKKKTYDFDIVKYTLTDELADLLIELDEQLKQMIGLNLATKEGITAQAELVDGLTDYTFDEEQQFAEPFTEESLAKLDVLFPTLRIRMNKILLNKDKYESETGLLFKLLAYAPKFKEEKPELQEKQRLRILEDLMTPQIADTLVELKESLDGMEAAEIRVQDMKVTEPKSEGQPHVYEFEDDNVFLPLENNTPEVRRKQEGRLAELDTFFAGGTKIQLNKIIGFGPMDLKGSPLARDWETLYKLFPIAKKYKERKEKRNAKAAEEEAAERALEAVDLTGTPFEELAGPIEAEYGKSPYEVTDTSNYTPMKHDSSTGEVTLPKQKGFIPATRRAFGYFIYDKFQNYRLKALESLDPNACAAMGDSSTVTQIYEYQKFVRDYISYMTPYRGVLVYHGLGSGKTCTAIAASEALFASGGKSRVVVMTPFSLRKNFIQQVTFCGFRHFRLLNHWVSYDYKASDGKNALYLFATTVLRIPKSYFLGKKGSTKHIWIPDLNKPQSEENYTKLPSEAQAEIREQIYRTLLYNPDTKEGMIEFINYNGVTATTLKTMACQEGYFDNTVIVVDEIHNLVRLMQGTIDSYLKKLFLQEIKQGKQAVDPDKITSEPWKPKYCNRSKNYKRGYLFYRLLIGAKNTKIVGLSGTPLINFPEELGILANILHGYNFVYTAKIPKVTQAGGNERLIQGLKQMAEGMDPENFCPDIDFYEVTTGVSASDQTIQFTFTFLPEGYRKVQGQLGVERIPFTEALETTATKKLKVEACITKILQKISPVLAYKGITEKAEPLLPVLGEPSEPTVKTLDDSFKGRFVEADGTSIANSAILFKRLSGLISYYKGSRKDLMPEIIEDSLVPVPMSLDQQKKYVAIRLQEIKIEQKKETQKRKGGPVDAAAIKGEDAELKKLSSSQNYRMASRQACNFVFPDGFTRPRPQTAEQIKQADEFGGSMEDLLGDERTEEPSALVGTPEEEAAAAERDRAEAEAAKAEDEKVSKEQEAEELEAARVRLTAEGKTAAVIEAELQAIRARYEEERLGEVVVAAPEEEELAESISPAQKRCLANLLPGESYQAAILRAKNCLLTLGLPKLRLQDPDRPEDSPLERWSPKYKAILEKLEEIQGSSLVYSQFLGMEGIGIFTIAMQANGYVPIVIKAVENQYVFDEATEASIRKGPSVKENRFILFTGGESEQIRKINIDLFNAKLTELPPRIRAVLEESGFTSEVGNKRGELCRVFCITAAGAEGLSLKNVRGVHIMEPYWNDVRMAQVKGRAVRICSHQELPLKERNVRIFTYMTVFSTEAQTTRGDPREGDRMKWAIPQEIWNRDGINRATAESYGIAITRDDYCMTSDERLYYISEKKKKLVNNLVIIMKSAAADCLLNYEENKDGTFMCRMLGNEGDFMYHPNLQKDIETSKGDEVGDLFSIPSEELERVRAAQAKLVFEETKEEEEEEEEKEEAAAPPPPPPREEAAALEAPKPAAPKPGRVQVQVTLRLDPKTTDKTPFVAVGMPKSDKGDAYQFYLFSPADKAFANPLFKADGILVGTKWQPNPKTIQRVKK